MIIGLSGYAQAGKDTTGSILVEEHGFHRVAFADALKDFLYALNPIIHSGGVRLRSVVDQRGWEFAKRVTEVRELLQRLGTEAGRGILGQDIWIRTAMAKLHEGNHGNHHVFTDVRFPNEATMIKHHGGEVWRVWRPGTRAANAHASETSLDDWTFDYEIPNNGTIDDLRRIVRVAMFREA
jgi:hypothetical protein